MLKIGENDIQITKEVIFRMTHMVNTVTDPVSTESLGKTPMHEHFFFRYP